MPIKTAAELAAKCKEVAQNYKTLYVLGCFGAPLNAKNKERYSSNVEYNRQPARTAKIKAAYADTFGFDCVCLIKALLWGWNGDKSANYGGAVYKANNVPDIGADKMILECSNVSTDFSKIEVGEVVWMSGHIGVYIGGGLAVESTPVWKDGVQITAVHNIGKKAGYNGRKWTKHGKLPYVSYTNKTEAAPATPTTTTKPTETKKGDYTLEMRILSEGCTGEDVRALQYLLIANGCSCGISGADGSFGPATKKAVIAYQKKKGLSADGIAGPKTMSKLLGV